MGNLILDFVFITTAGLIVFFAYKVGQIRAELQDSILRFERDKIEDEKRWSKIKSMIEGGL